MNHRDVALRYLKAFCAGDLGALQPLLAADLRFSGPLHQFDSRAAYMQSLAADPPGRCGFSIASITESDESVAVFWEYQKPGKPLMIAQLFKIRGGKIGEILVVFDAKSFERQGA